MMKKPKYQSITMNKVWKAKTLIVCHSIAIMLIFSWLCPITRQYWDTLDLWFFRLCNNSLAYNDTWKMFWAYANIPAIADILMAIIIIGICLWYVFHRHDNRKIRFNHFVFLSIVIILAVIVSKQILQLLPSIDRHSPSVILSDTISLSKLLPQWHVRDISYDCFPGDHALTVIMWTMLLTFFGRWHYAIVAAICAIIFMLPRLFSGAHWLTDDIVGSASIALVIFSWTTASPIYSWIMALSQKITDLLYKIFSRVISC